MTYIIRESGVLRDPVQDDLTDPRLDAFMIETHDELDLTDDEIAELREDYNFGQCGCSHDCCGHRYGGVSSITKISPGSYIMLVYSACNY